MSLDGLGLFVLSGEILGFLELKEHEINQYIGIKDRNGKEIYEGDVIQSTYSDGDKTKPELIKCELKWSCGCCYFIFGWNIKYYDLDCSEIIGNIYQNPELLEKE